MYRFILHIVVAFLLISSASAEFKTKNVAIYVYEGVDLLDISAPGELLSIVKISDENKNIIDAYNVYLVALDKKDVIGNGFASIKPNYTIYDCPEPDIIIIPGGSIELQLNSYKFLKWLKFSSQNSEIIMGISSGIYALATADLLNGKKATVWNEAIDVFNSSFPEVEIIRNVKFTDSDNIVTAPGSANSIDATLHIIVRTVGHEAANYVANYINYLPWFDGSVKLD